MIGISYLRSTPFYDAYLKKIQDRLSKYLNLFMRKRPDADRVECMRFINMYLSGNNFVTVMNTPAVGIRALIDDVELNFPDLKNCRKDKSLRESSPLYQFLKYYLVKHGYENGFDEKNIPYRFPKKELIESVGIVVCPYCNRTFIYTTKTVQGNKVSHAELDHFFSKDLFPYLAIAKYNLIPSCSCCNRNGGKFTTDAYCENLINPYEIGKPNDYLEFRLRIKNANITSLENLASGLSFKLISKHPNMRNNINALNLDALYQHHTDYAAEMYFKSIVKATHIYRSSLKSILRRRGINLSDDDIKRIIVGNYVREADFGKRPLSKMMHDVATELGLI